ncbi:hypothetical protein RND81_02G139800 [Saponaria officinalis]|uniref:RING-type E3 ubiquitin transferase n=1 Tax=Saponaria officinalis TaxID=3572 RepID=A0AAW1MPZ7_SAPOF
MGSDAYAVQETISLSSVKVHLSICKPLLRLVEKISCIIPEIEAARPGSSQGMQALCLLHKANDRAKELIQNCDSSKLYLAVTGDQIVKRFEKTRTLLSQSLTKLQSMVPVVLGTQISDLLHDLRDVVFSVDSNETLAGKALKALLEREASPVDSVGNSEIELLQFAASALHISSQKDLLIERRSLKKLIDKTKEGNSKKRITLTYFLHILKKYDKQILQGKPRELSSANGQTNLLADENRESVIPETTDCDSNQDYPHNSSQNSIPRTPTPPEEFICHLSSKLMYDPVVISSGQTFERSYIQKLFDEGHDTCPITKMKLPHLYVIPNTSMKHLIVKWSTEHGINMSVPHSSTQEHSSLETSYNSISSTATASSMGDIQLWIGMSSMSIGSLGSLDSSYSSISRSKLGDSFGSVREASEVDSRDFQFYRSIDDVQRQLLLNISGLPWESRYRAVRDVNNFMMYDNPSCSFVSSENFLNPLVRFLEDALSKRDVEAQKVGNQLLLTFLRASRTQVSHLNIDVYTLLASYLATEATAEMLSIIEVLSTQSDAIPHLAASGVLTTIIKLLDTHNRDFLEAAVKILFNISMNIDASSCKLASDWVPKLVPLLEDGKVAGTCINILENLSKFEETRVSIAETNGCIASIIKLLEMGCSVDTQEHAVSILYPLCAQRSRYCQLVLYEGGVPALCHVSVNGTVKGKSIASELLRLLRDIEYEDEYEVEHECPVLNNDDEASEDRSERSENKSQKISKFSGWKKRIFSKKK